MANPVNGQAVAGQVLVTRSPTAILSALAQQILMTPSSALTGDAVAGQVLLITPTNTEDTNLTMEVLASGYIPDRAYGTTLEVLSGFPYVINDASVFVEVLAAATVIPVKPSQSITFFSPS